MIDEDMIATLQIQADRIAELERERDEWRDACLSQAEKASAGRAKVARLRKAFTPILDVIEHAFPSLANFAEFRAARAALQDTQP